MANKSDSKSSDLCENWIQTSQLISSDNNSGGNFGICLSKMDSATTTTGVKSCNNFEGRRKFTSKAPSVIASIAATKSRSRTTLRPILDDDDDNITVITLEEELQKCKSHTAVLLLLNSQLRAHQTFDVGDCRLYSSISDASRYIQRMCDKNEKAQHQLRSSGVLGSIVDAFMFFYDTHLKGHADPLYHTQLVDCWSQICSALWEAVGNPINHRNQETVIGKFIEKNDLRFIEFVGSSSKSIAKQTENYVIPLIQLIKALVMDNKTVQALVNSRQYFVTTLGEGLIARLQFVSIDPILWKSLDLMAWLLSMLVPKRNGLSLSQSQGSSANTSRPGTASDATSDQKHIDRILADLISPCLQFLDMDKLSQKTYSLGVIMLFTSILVRDIDLVRRFIAAGGEMIFSQIFSTDPPIEISEATKYAFKILNVQKQQMRQKKMDTSINQDRDEDKDISGFKNSSDEEPYPKTFFWDLNSSCSYVEAWINNTTNEKAADRKTPSNDSGFAVPPPPPGSIADTSISQYKKLTVCSDMNHRKMATPFFKSAENGFFYGVNCSSGSGYLTPSISNYHHHIGVGCCHLACCRVPTPMSCLPSYQGQGHYTVRSESRVLPGNKRHIAQSLTNNGDRNEYDENHQINEDQTNEDFDRESVISISFPRKKFKKSNTEPVENQTVNGEFSKDKISKVLNDFQPFKILETADHFVVYCSPQKSDNVKPNDNSVKSQTEKNENSSDVKRNENGESSGLFGSIINWILR